MRIIYVLCLIAAGSMFATTKQNQATDLTEYYATRVIVKDSVFMDMIVNTIESDSVYNLLKSTYLPRLKREMLLKSHCIAIFYGDRHICKECNILNEPKLLTDTVEEIINKDPAKKITLCFSDSEIFDHVTTYKGYRFVFFRNFKVNTDSVFTKTQRKTKCISSLDAPKVWVPFVYQNGKMYIEPDYMQWVLIHE